MFISLTQLIILVEDGVCKLFDMRTMTNTASKQLLSGVLSVHFDGVRLAAGLDDNTVRL